MNTYSQQKKILIIKFGGLGDIILSLDAIFSIKNHHKMQTILLTEKPYDSLLSYSKWFDKIITIKRSFFYFLDIFQIKKKIRNCQFEFVYDLQTSSRSSNYLKHFNNSFTVINGIGKYANYDHNINKNRNNMHTVERQKDQLSLSKVEFQTVNDLRWLFQSKIAIPKEKYVLIIPGGSGKRKNKRVPVKVYKMAIDFLLKKQFKILIIGSKDEEIICQKIKLDFPEVINLCKKTSLLDLAKLSKYSELSIGNDTGPMHLVSKGGKKCFVFFTKHSKAQLCSPTGDNVSIFHYNGNDNSFFSEVLKSIKSKLSL